MVDRVMAQAEGTRFFLLAPMVRGRKGEYRKELAELQKKGFQRVRIDGEFYDIADAPTLDKKYKHDIDVVVDRIVVRDDIQARLADSLETALKLAEGLAVAEFADEKDEQGKPRQLVFSEKFACPVSGFTIPEIEPRLFSFNNPFGACPVCDGLGSQRAIDPKLIVPDENRTLKAGAIAPWAKSTSPYYLQTLEALSREYEFKLTDKWSALPQKTQDAILHGTGSHKIQFRYSDGLRLSLIHI